ncbi:molybdopterin-dependent oxidoreductase [Gynuella sp.]|uniref:molybdopterin-dependent oxidoreductase n=1 Tax=Gynuella sp. TaxID=2969146 RepID=UPI003D13316C
MTQETVYSVCPHDCPSVCALEVERIDGHRIGKVKGSKDLPYTGGVICGKVARYQERMYHPERLLHPLRRVGPKGSGQFERISWDEALDTVAEAFTRVEQQYGAEAVWPYFYAGTMGLLMRKGINRLRHAKGYSNMAGTICVGLSNPGWQAGAGGFNGVDAREMAKSEVIVIWGANVVSTQVHVMSHALEGMRNGAKLVVVDPYFNKTAQRADVHLALRPGTDGALACAVMHVLFRDGYADWDYLKRYTDEPEALEQHLRDKTPVWAAAITGLTVEAIEAFAHLYGGTKKSYLRLGYGFSRSRNGAVNMHAVSCLPAVTGAWAVEGGGALFSVSALAKVDMQLIEAKELKQPGIRTLDMSRIGDILTGDSEALCGGPPVMAMLIQNTNPVVVAPESAKVRAGFGREDLFVCVHEQFMTETAQMADIVLPATMFLEHDDIYNPGGHAVLQVARQVVPAAGECRSNHEVISALGLRLGVKHRSFDMNAWDILDESLKASGYPSAQEIHDQRGLDVSTPFAESHFLNGFLHADGKFHFRADWASLGAKAPGMSDLPDHWAVTDETSEQYPFRLVTAPAQNFLNSSFNEIASSRKKEQQPKARIHVDVLNRMGVADGARVRIGNAQGSVLLVAEAATGQHADTVVVEGLWPDESFIEGQGINLLTSSEPGYPAGGAAFHDTSIWLRPDSGY